MRHLPRPKSCDYEMPSHRKRQTIHLNTLLGEIASPILASNQHMAITFTSRLQHLRTPSIFLHHRPLLCHRLLLSTQTTGFLNTLLGLSWKSAGTRRLECFVKFLGDYISMVQSFSLSKGARQPARQLWSLEHLVHERSIALGFTIDTGTAHTYSSALNLYIAFCQLHHFPIQPTEDTLSFFVIYMSYHIKPKSVDSYLSGICNQLQHYFPDVHAVRKSLLVK